MEQELRKIIREEIKRLTEVRILKRDVDQETKPLKDSDTIRVYHGFGGYSKHYAFLTAEFGILGNEIAGRAYSYEMINNPKGLFVSTDAKMVMDNFANSGVVIEFHTKVSNLEAPVWNSANGSWFGQGAEVDGFGAHDEPEFYVRRNKRRIQNRRSISSDSSIRDVILNSDRPELAYSLMTSGERQALFTSTLNPKQIKAFWVKPYYLTDGADPSRKWERMSVKEFKKRFSNYSGSATEDDSFHIQKIVKPSDNLRNYKNAMKVLNYAYKKLKSSGERFIPTETFLDYLNHMSEFVEDQLYSGQPAYIVYDHQVKDFLRFAKAYKTKKKENDE
jgi:hypothetical protein